MREMAASFEKSNIYSLRVKLIELLGDEDEVKEYKGLAREYVCGKYDWDEVVKETLELY